MTLERIRNTIIEEAEREARQIVARAEKESQERLERGRAGAEEEFQARLEAARRRIGRDAERRLMHRRSELNMRLLVKRNEILNSVFEQAAGRLAELDDEQYRNMLSAWAARIPPDSPGEMLCNSDETGRIAPLIEALNKERDEEARIELLPDESVENGLVFRSQNFEIDLTIRSRLDGLREELTPELARILFKKKVKV